VIVEELVFSSCAVRFEQWSQMRVGSKKHHLNKEKENHPPNIIYYFLRSDTQVACVLPPVYMLIVQC
jgi:hypothetical protein